MASGALFGASGTPSQSKNLVEFRAGKMHLKGKMVNPDKKKGQVYIYQSDDSLMHFCWKDRTSGTVENDLIIFPDDIEFKHVSQCTTGRVYVLKFKSSAKRLFFWMQEPKTDKDEEYCKKVNEYLNNPPAPGSNRGGAGGLPADLGGIDLGDTDLQSMLGNMSQQQLMQLFGGMGMSGLTSLASQLGGGRPSSAQSTTSEPPLRVQSSPGSRATTAGDTTPSSQARPVTAAALPTQQVTATPTNAPGATPATPTAPVAVGAGARPPIQLSDLQNILSNMNVPEGEAKEAINLSQALNPESLIPLLANPDIQQRLTPFLPQGEALPKTEQELRNTVQSPQFQQALGSFSAALQSGQLGPLMPQFGLGEAVANAAAQGDLEAFVKAMQANSKEAPGEGSEKKKDDDKKDDQ